MTGPEIGVDHGGGHPLELAEFGRHVVGDAGERVREFLRQDAGGDGFVRASHEAVQEADRDGLDAGVPQTPNGGADGGFVQRHLDRTVVADAFGDLQPQVAGDQHDGLVGLRCRTGRGASDGRFPAGRGIRRW